nr:molecular chaperone [uncultured Enterobacter sp.]
MKLLGFILLMLATTANAGIVLGGTRVVYPSDKNEVQISLKNKDEQNRYLIQSWVSYPDDTKAPFIITPPIYKLEENRQTLLHIIYAGDEKALVQDRETLFLVNVKSVSAIPQELREKNTLQLALKSRIKLFYRPAALDNALALAAWEKLTFRRQGNTIVAKNPTPFYVTFNTLAIGGKSLEPTEQKEIPSALTMMVAPFSEQSFPAPAGASGEITWSALNDFGAETVTKKQAL